MTDQEHARAIVDAEHALNAAIIAASEAGLRVDFEMVEHHLINHQFPTTVVSVTVMRPLVAK